MITDTNYPPNVIADARAWIEDVVGNAEDVEDATDADVIAFVRKHYEGGIGAFVADGHYAATSTALRAAAYRYRDEGMHVFAAHLMDAARARDSVGTY